MLPYLAQGANSSLEDGAVLGRLLRYVTSHDKLAPALEVYEQLRKSRGEAIAKEALGQVSSTTRILAVRRLNVANVCKKRDSFHLPDGPLQEQRDSIFMTYLGKEPPAHFPSRW